MSLRQKSNRKNVTIKTHKHLRTETMYFHFTKSGKFGDQYTHEVLVITK